MAGEGHLVINWEHIEFEVFPTSVPPCSIWPRRSPSEWGRSSPARLSTVWADRSSPANERKSLFSWQETKTHNDVHLIQELDDEEYKANSVEDDDSKVGDAVSWALTANIVDILHYAAVCPEERECYSYHWQLYLSPIYANVFVLNSNKFSILKLLLVIRETVTREMLKHFSWVIAQQSVFRVNKWCI